MDRQLLTQLLAWKNKGERKPLLVDGARQTGKTYLLRELLGREFPNVLHLDFLENPALSEAFAESLTPKNVISNIESFMGQPFNPETDLLILDEIGECQKAVTSLKYFAEKAPTWFVAASGSNIGLLTSFPVGQVEEYKLRPMTFQEFLWASGEPALAEAFETETNTAAVHSRLFDMLTDYYFTGGMPEAVSNWYENAEKSILECIDSVQRVHQNLLENYKRDFGKYAGKANAQLIEAVFDNIPSQLSVVVDESVKRFKFKGILPRKSRYAEFESAINWLSKCRLVLKNYPIQGHPQSPLMARRKSNMVKLFMFDVGVLNSMLGTSYNEIKQKKYEYKGYIAENFVQQELSAIGIEPSYSWSGKSAEIEFVLSNDNGQVFPVEVKSGKRTRSKSLQSYREQYQPHKTFKLTGTQGSDSKQQAHITLPLYYAMYLPKYW